MKLDAPSVGMLTYWCNLAGGGVSFFSADAPPDTRQVWVEKALPCGWGCS
jgi:hypothetical protein